MHVEMFGFVVGIEATSRPVCTNLFTQWPKILSGAHFFIDNNTSYLAFFENGFGQGFHLIPQDQSCQTCCLKFCQNITCKMLSQGENIIYFSLIQIISYPEHIAQIFWSDFQAITSLFVSEPQKLNVLVYLEWKAC